MRSTRTRTLFSIGVCVLLVACGGAAEEDADTSADTLAADTTAEAEPEIHADSIPSRQDEVARDEGSKPQALMDYVGIERGDAVVDIVAGSGYFTYLTSERVGPDGRIYAQGYRPALKARVERGDLASMNNVVLVDSLENLPEGAIDHVIMIRAYHLFEDPSALLDPLMAALKPGGTIGIVELRLGEPTGHDMETHRMGEQSVIDEMTAAGFEYVGESDILRNPEDDHTEFWEGRRHLADRMLLKFSKPGEEAPGTSTARR